MFSLKVDDEISLRLHDAYNIEGFFQLIANNRAHLGKYMDWEKYHQNVDDSFDFVLQARKNFGKRQRIGTQIYYNGEIAGSIGLTIHDWQSGFAEIGYWLGVEFTGKGIITRATHAMTNFAFNVLNLHKVILKIMTDNEKSIAVAKRVNFAYEGIQVQQRLLRGKHYDFHVYYMLRDNWLDTTTPHFEYPIDDRITLRPVMMHDAKALFALIDNNRDNLGEWLAWVDSQKNLADTQKYIKDSLTRYGDYKGLDCAICYDEKLCGLVSFNSWSLRNYKADIGYWLAPEFTDKGIMTKSLKALINYGFNVVGLHRLEVLCAVHNTRSCAVAERLNFTHEGVIRRGERIRDKFYDTNAYALLEDDWEDW